MKEPENVCPGVVVTVVAGVVVTVVPGVVVAVAAASEAVQHAKSNVPTNTRIPMQYGRIVHEDVRR